MYARNRRTGSAITSTLETVHGQCSLIADGFERNNDGGIEHEYGGSTEMYWDSSKQVVEDGEPIYLDEDSRHVRACDIELHAEDGAPEPAPPPRPRRAGDDPEAAARGVAERLVAQMVGEVDDYHEALAAAREVGREDGEEEAERAIDKAREAFVQSAVDGIDDIEIASGFLSLSTARDTMAPIVKHADRAVIRLKGPNAVRVHCSRSGERFSVDEISARECGHVCRLEPDEAHAAQLDVYADAVLQTQGPWD